jgi:hypothetical protein
MFPTTIQACIEDAEGLTDRESDPALEGGSTLRWAIQEAQKLWAECTRINRDQFTLVSNAFTIPSGNTHLVGADGDGVSPIGSTGTPQFLSPRGVDISNDGGVNWLPLRHYRFDQRGGVYGLMYRWRGNTLELLPAEHARMFQLRYWYVFVPKMIDGKDTLTLPVGGAQYIAQGVAALIRDRFEEDGTPHLLKQSMALDKVKLFLTTQGQGGPTQIKPAGGVFDVDLMGDL